jgi:hypothetical protein
MTTPSFNSNAAIKIANKMVAVKTSAAVAANHSNE